MIANWKSLILASIGLAVIAGADPNGDMDVSFGSKASGRSLADAHDCISHHSTRCMVEVKYAYPAADLYVVPEEVYF
jgi:hypothetical protein